MSFRWLNSFGTGEPLRRMHEFASVRRCGVAGTQGLGVRLLDHLAITHDQQPPAQMRHHSEIVADEHIGQAPLGPQPFEQVEDFRLDRGIKRRCRFVEQDDLGIEYQGASNRDALTT